MPVAYWCILVAALLPTVFVMVAKRNSRNNHTPRDEAATLTGAQRRAYAAHLNAYENFPFFAAAVIIAVTQGASIATVNMLAMIYVVLRIAHGVLYIADQSTSLAGISRRLRHQYRHLRAAGVQIGPAIAAPAACCCGFCLRWHSRGPPCP